MEVNSVGYRYLLSKEEDEALMHEITSIVLNNRELEPKERTEARQAILEYIRSLLNQWIKQCFKERMYSFEVVENVFGFVFPYGSFALNMCYWDSDMDLVCVVPGEITSEDYFSTFYQFLSTQDRIKNLNAIPLAKVPLIGCQIDGINVDLPMVSVEQYLLGFPPTFSIFDDSLDATMNDSYALSLNGPRTAKLLLEQIQNKDEFVLLAATIRYIIKKRLCYKTIYGYLGGIHIAIMLCKLLKQVSGSPLYILYSFFTYYASTLGTEVITIKSMVDDTQDLRSPLIILTPAKLLMNSARGTTRSTLHHIRTQMKVVVNQLALVVQKIHPASLLFEEYPFFEEFPWFIQIDIATEKKEDFEDWAGYVESKLRLLTIFIKREGVYTIPYPGRLPTSTGGFSCRFVMGLSVQGTDSVLDLSDAMNSFIDVLRLEQLEGMNVSITATSSPRV